MTNYVRPPEFHVLERDNSFLYIDPVNHVWFATDVYGAAALRGFFSNLSIAEAEVELAQVSGLEANDPQVAEYVSELLTQLINIGFLHYDVYVDQKLRSSSPEYPFVMYLHLTNSCNLACSYCYNQEHRHNSITASRSTFSKNRYNSIDLAERFKTVLNEAACLGLKEVKLTGGEATLFKEYLSVAKHAKSLGLRVNLMTNGLGVTADKAREIVDSVDSVSISIDSRYSNKHDTIRGRGSHEMALRAVSHLKEAGLKYLHLNGVVTPSTIDDTYDLLAFATDNVKADSVTLAPSSIKVRDPDDRWGASEQFLTASQLRQVDAAQAAFFKERKGPPSVPHRNHCGVGQGVVSIDPNGDVYPCQTLHETDFLCGNAFETGLKAVLDSSPVTKRMKESTVDSIEECNVCPVRYICHSGCRAESYTSQGKFNVRNVESCPSFYAASVDSLWESVLAK